MQQYDVIRQYKLAASLMPSGPVTDQDSDGAGATCVLISARCRFMHSVLAAGVMTAAPTARAGQIAPKMYAVSCRLSRTMGGREPIGAQT